VPLQSFAVYLALPCTLLIFAIGYYLGRTRVKHEREAVLNALASMLKSADQLSHDVGSHNNELADMGKSVEHLDVSVEMNQVQKVLLGHIKEVISSNVKLEDDLTCARYDLAKQAQELDITRAEARTDELSHVGNRKAFDEAFQYWLSKWSRKGEYFALVISDIDHFKWINDTHGHAAGDRVVVGVGAILREFMGKKHFVARYGGDEFVLLLACNDRQATIELAIQIRESAEQQNFSAAGDGGRVAITLSTGMAFVREGDTAESLFRRADAKLYAAKQAGRNCLRVDEEQTENAATINDDDDAAEPPISNVPPLPASDLHPADFQAGPPSH